ncbi:MAG: ArsC/Spx/MgsR family protein [Reichenbachiella sp.]|uniref:arsenate reductase family protein n=1 Tax=Reichenbachiella sp. TaxID=2184521 RepID=UPI003267ABFD
MRKIYYLATCSTCIRIIKELGITDSNFDMQDIKTQPITSDHLDEMKGLSGSYESLFSRRAMKYKSMGLASQQLSEQDYKRLIVEEYTFLKRPVFIVDNEIFVGNAKKIVDAVGQAIG